MDTKDSKKKSSAEIFETLSLEEQEAVKALDSLRKYKKGDIIIREGQIFHESYFVIKGLVRKYKLEDGHDTTVEFYSDDQDVFTFSSSAKPIPSKFNLECIEDSELSVVSFEQEQAMLKRFPRFERMCRITTEHNLMKYQERFANFISWTPEQRYLDLMKNRPDLIERVPQYHLASYLGVKPETLSRIRKRIASR